MAYKIAGIDVHKRVLMVVVMDASAPEEKPDRVRLQQAWPHYWLLLGGGPLHVAAVWRYAAAGGRATAADRVGMARKAKSVENCEEDGKALEKLLPSEEIGGSLVPWQASPASFWVRSRQDEKMEK